MPTRSPWPGQVVDGEIASADDFNSIPGGYLGFASTATAQASITSETDLTSLTVSVTVPTDRLILVRTRVLFDIDNTGAANISGFVYSDGVNQGHFARGKGLQNSELLGSGPVYIDGLSAGTHTIKLRAARTSGTGVVTTIAASDNLNFILVEDLGPSVS